MSYFSFILTAVAAGSLAMAASAHESESVYKHGSAHHVHEDGNWHGQNPHMHGGVAMHRGHTHAAPVAPKCPNFVWHDTKDLQKWQVKHGSKMPCYSDDMHRCRGHKGKKKQCHKH